MNWSALIIPGIVLLMISAPFVLTKLGPRRWSQWTSTIPEPGQPAVSKPKLPWADDPVAAAAEWTGTSTWAPTRGGGCLEIRSASDSRLDFKPIHPVAFHVVMLILALAGATMVYSELGNVTQAVIALLAGMGLSFVVWLLVHLFGGRFVFDRHLGMFWEGGEQPRDLGGNGLPKSGGRCADVHALQLLSTYRYTETDTGTRTYNTFELNLVMKDATRRTVSRHDAIGRLERDARTLSTFLRKPLWDAH